MTLLREAADDWKFSYDVVDDIVIDFMETIWRLQIGVDYSETARPLFKYWMDRAIESGRYRYYEE